MNNREKMIEDDDDRAQGFRRGLEADKILGSADNNGELMYLIQWWVIFIIRKYIFVGKGGQDDMSNLKTIKVDWQRTEIILFV